MEVRSIYKFARVSPLKARDVAREIQGIAVSDALDILNFTPRKAAQLIGKTLRSAIANAENNHDIFADDLVVKEATVGDGPSFRRFKPRARGSAAPIKKRTCHIRIIVSDEIELPERGAKNDSKPKPKSKPKKKADPKPAEDRKEPAEEEAASAIPEGSKVDEKLGLVYESAPSDADDLKEISGVGPELESKLNGFGVYRFAQIADWNADQIAAFDDLLDFKGRIERDEWLKQAKELAG